MAIYKLGADPDAFDSLVLRNPTDWDLLRDVKGRRLPALPSRLRVAPHKAGSRGDFPYFASHIPVFGPRAWPVVEPMTHGCAQVFTLVAPGADYVALNVYVVPDSLDLTASSYTRTPSGYVQTIKRYVFKPGTIEGKDIFKVQESVVVDVLVSERFRETVEGAGLRGFVFTPAE
jgi:hypothetical protein